MEEELTMKILDVSHLQENIQQTKLDIESMLEEIKAIQYAVRDFYLLEGAFEGDAGEAIRHFYQDTHEPFLIFFQQSLEDYQTALENISSAVSSFESNTDGYVSQDYLTHEVPEGLKLAGEEATELTVEAQAIIDEVIDLVPILPLDESNVIEAVWAGQQKAEEIIENLVLLDNQGVAEMSATQADQETMSTFLSEMESTFGSKKSISKYSIISVQNMTSYQEVRERIETNNFIEDFWDESRDDLIVEGIRESGPALMRGVGKVASKGALEGVKSGSKFLMLNGEQIAKAAPLRKIAQTVTNLGNYANLAGAALSAVGLYKGFMGDIQKGKTPGQALAHTGTSFAVGTGTTALLTAFFNPVGFAAVGATIAVTAATTLGFEYLYRHDIMGTRTGVDNLGEKVEPIGQAIYKTIEAGKNLGSKLKNKVGEAVSTNTNKINQANELGVFASG